MQANLQAKRVISSLLLNKLIMKILSILLIGLGCLFIAGSFVMSAPQQAAMAGVACFMGILARIAQASAYRSEDKSEIKNIVS
ncbi:MAG: hypothetical protein IPJ09_00055 [Saprospiraceae bacterium]|nr:hypothetical protein [Saprospiraceae bacterium]